MEKKVITKSHHNKKTYRRTKQYVCKFCDYYTQLKGDYTKAKPHENRIKTVNRLYDDGNIIILLTARGMGRHKNDPKKE